VSSYAFLRRWLLPSPLPGCHGAQTTFPTERRLGNLSLRSGLLPSRPWILHPWSVYDSSDSWRIGSFPGLGQALGHPHPKSALPHQGKGTALYLNRFRRKPAISKFDWLFTPRHKSSPSIATEVSAVLHFPLRKLQPAHGEITWFRVKDGALSGKNQEHRCLPTRVH